ncbi:DUF6643 family protein [Streptomyces sp. BI20]|uniref:DUF6643 family protein n=1 Tax=Streptomyces sp. BI20 TaxID=3403460 RepID=UPI003C76F462
MTSPRSTYGGGHYSAPSFPDTPIYDSLVAERGTPQIAPIRVPAPWEPAPVGYSGSGHLPALPAALPALPSAPSPMQMPTQMPMGGSMPGQYPGQVPQQGPAYGYPYQPMAQQPAPLPQAPAPYVPQQAPMPMPQQPRPLPMGSTGYESMRPVAALPSGPSPMPTPVPVAVQLTSTGPTAMPGTMTNLPVMSGYEDPYGRPQQGRAY